MLMDATVASPSFLEEQRLRTLRDYGVLDTPRDQGFEQLAALAAACLDAPIALIGLLDSDREWLLAATRPLPPEIPRADAFAAVIAAAGGPLAVADIKRDARFAGIPLAAGPQPIRFYAGAPLLTADGQILGAFSVLDVKPRRFDQAQLALLTGFARQAMALLEQRRTAATLRQQLSQSTAERTRLELALEGAHDGWWDWDLIGHTRFESERLWEMLGYGSEERPRTNGRREIFVHPDDRLALNASLNAAIRGTATYHSVEYRLMHRDGRAIPVLSRSYIQRDATGRALRLSGTTMDLTERKAAENARLQLEEDYRNLFVHSMDGVLLAWPEQETVLAANPAACTMLGKTEEALKAAGWHSFLDPADPRLAAMLQQRAAEGWASGEATFLRADGERFEVWLTSVLYQDRYGRTVASTIFRDVTERQVLADRLKASLDLLNNLAEHVPGFIFQYQLEPDGTARFPFASRGITEIYELTPEDVAENSAPTRLRLHPEDAPHVIAAFRESGQTLQPWHQEYRVVLPRQGVCWRQGDAQPERLANGGILFHGFITDITKRKAAESESYRLAYFDDLTGLPNRRFLTDRLAQCFSAARRSGRVGAVLFVDLDNFKQINDARGHSTGDQLLKLVSQRMVGLLRLEDTLARLGGDEFVVVIGDLGDEVEPAARAAASIAEKMREVLSAPYDIGGASYTAMASIGVTLFPQGQRGVDDVLREADTAMYGAKSAGRNRIAFFEAAMQAEVEDRLAIEQDLKTALAGDQFRIHVQTQVAANGSEIGGELLLRWNHPVRGLIEPSVFIPVAETTGQIFALGEMVLRQGCKALARIHRAGLNLSLSINVSPRQFHQEDFVGQVKAILAKTGAPAGALIFEVTEGLLIGDWQDASRKMAELVTLGIRFSIDDFGTGYSSLAYLKKLPLYEIKIDQSFVQDTPQDANDTAIVQSIMAVARNLHLKVIAEGVEKQEQADFLTSIGCDGLQGFLIAQPVEMDAWLGDRLNGHR
jgi:diguanylate cyclase (GGDEF)-like protein/PAS domain S-box-containing protein